MEDKEHPLITADQWYEFQGKAGMVLYGLKNLMGEDNLNIALRDFKNAYAYGMRAQGVLFKMPIVTAIYINTCTSDPEPGSNH